MPEELFQPITVTSERRLFAIVQADVLLATEQNKKIINNIQQITNITNEQFTILYQELINNFVEFVQLLPSSNAAQLGSLIHEGLVRALLALQQQKDYTENQHPDPLLTYALFSAALLFELGFTINNRTVIISEQDGTFVQEWIPSKGSMQTTDKNYYRIRFAGGISAKSSRRITPLLAQQIMPLIGFNWLAQDYEVFNTWIRLLNNEQDTTNNLDLYLNYAHKKILNISSQELPPNIYIITPEDTTLGEDFLVWLKQGINAQTISINTYNSDIHLIENGLFIEIPEIITKFCIQTPKKPMWKEVFAQLKKIGFINPNTEQLVTYTYTAQTQPLPFIQKLSPKQETNKLPKDSWYQNNRHGVEIFNRCFIFLLLADYANLAAENNFLAIEFAKEKIKKKIKILTKLKQRRKRLKALDQEIQAAMLRQLKKSTHSNNELKKWLEKLQKLDYE